MKVAALPDASRRHAVREWAGFPRSLPGAGPGTGDHVLRRGAGRLRVRVRRSGRRHRLAAGRRRDRLPLPRRGRPVAGRAGRRPPGQRLLGAAHRLRGRPDVRQSARGAGRDAADAPADPARRAAGQCRGPRADGRGDGRRGGGQRDRRRAVAAPRRGDRHGGRARRLAHVVAGRLRRRPGRRAGCAGLVPAAAAPLAAWSRDRGRADGRRRRRRRASSRSAATSPWPTSSFRR